jgi:hemolysin III
MTAAQRAYSVMEEVLHTVTHGIGAVLCVIGLIFLVMKATLVGGSKEVIAVSIFAASGILLYVCSTLYHGAHKSSFQPFLKALDHSAIYVKIAGSYTPFALLTLSPRSGIIIMVVVWALATIGVTMKFVAHYLSGIAKYKWVSLAGYLGMGWVAIFVVWELWQNLPVAGFMWLLAGGLCFTVGAAFYAFKSVAYTHTAFHIFVIAGSVCHFVSVYGYVLKDAGV